ncbi:4-diphosphocytidyl-2-C-methyl-D-erythritol kinase [Candidatus Rickettsiella viridis]|uniref:4-diphosphocytidyl-2-C-methyl-D-erythritol kinase n=1 Tax=Candidatus Rickettsiella viridis TaxID=676208 RepID=A0A2Z5UW29_9COXI|nr:4-(cytidine 5'-diphospho)-2-C-methyl-D-erythritol kinase [Candidatus Rickettsiella viridis]BBB15193.1 4-diphosphocytidyl-2-C-methyl-D-erythritol kinase [Candidatus Rickettsiella viridis]
MKTYWPSPAKLNLFLHIVGRRNDGYHDLQTIFQLLDYGDELTFTPRSDQQITCTCFSALEPDSPSVIPEDDNLAIKAARLLQQTKNKIDTGMDIHIEKRIPIGGGLGGGSSNAATTLLALNYLWQLNLSLDELLKLGVTLGADVPVFIKGHTSWAEGIGEKLQAITLPEAWYLVLIPPQAITTAKLFLDPRLTYNTTAIRIQTFLSEHLKTGNDFEPIVRQDYPVIAEALDYLNHFAPAHLSGTGSCIFTALDTKIQAELLQEKIKSRYRSFISKGLSISPLHRKLDALQTQ